MTNKASVDVNRIDKDFEALWARATNVNKDAPVLSPTSIDLELTDDLSVPTWMLDYIAELATRCHGQGMLDEFQLAKILQCSKDQQMIFDEIESSQLQKVVASIQNN